MEKRDIGKLLLSSLLAAAIFAGCAARTSSDANLAAPAIIDGFAARLSAMSDEPAAPTTAPALPAGHPAIPQDAANAPTLPSGHPDISKMAPAKAAFPPGHPDITKSNPPATQPAAFGILTIRAVQGTKGGPAVGGEDVTVQIYESNHLTGSVSGKLDSTGAVNIDGVPLSPRHQALVKVTHAGVEYQAVSEASDGATKNLQLTVPVYAATNETPAWTVQMQHMIVQPVNGGVQVMEVLAIENPTDRAWTGKSEPGADKPVTFTLRLPSGASDVTLVGGFHDCCTTIKDGTVINAMALVPGVTRYQLSYFVPSDKGVARLAAVAPAPVKHMMIIIPDDGTKLTGEGLDGPKTTDMGNGKTRYFAATDVPAGKEVAVTITGTPKPASTGAAAGRRAGASAMAFAALDSAGITKAIAGVGAILILLLGGAFLVVKSPRNPKTTHAARAM